MSNFICMPTDCIKSLMQSIRSELGFENACVVSDQDILSIEIDALYAMLETTDVVVSPIMNSKLFDSKRSSKSARQELIDNKSVYCVIQLAPSLLDSTSVSLSLIILKKSSDVIRFVDASDIYTQAQRNLNTLSDKDISQIIDMINNPSGLSVHLVADQIDDDYSLSAIGYVKEARGNKSLREIALTALTGMKPPEKKSDGCISAKVIKSTDVKRFSLISIDSLAYVSIPESFLKKHRLNGRYLLISRNGASQIDVADKDVIISAGVTAIELACQELYDYVEAYLNSDAGIQEISGSSSSTHTIGSPRIDDIYIKIPDMNSVKSIGTAYATLRESIIAVNSCADRIVKSINDLF